MAEPVYDALILDIFHRHYEKGMERFEFERSEIVEAAERLGLSLPRNVGDVVYSFRYRKDLPDAIARTAPKGYEWHIEGAGRSRYRFRLAKEIRIAPNPHLRTIKIPEATPEIIGRYALSDEQALLAKVRYNRLIDIFLGITAYSLQNHLRTTVKSIGQIEIDELYVGINQSGTQYVVPVQAKGKQDRVGAVQTLQDLRFCEAQFSELVCRPVAAQSLARNRIAMFELSEDEDGLVVVQEKHYSLVPADQISKNELESYRVLGGER